MPSRLDFLHTTAESSPDAPESMPAYRVIPRSAVHGGVLLLPGLHLVTEGIRELARRIAGENYVVVVPDIASTLHIDEELGDRIEDAAHTSPDTLDPQLAKLVERLQTPQTWRWVLQSLRAMLDALCRTDGVDGRVGVLGAGWGGRQAYALAAVDPRVRIAMSYDGIPTDTDVAEGIRGAAVSFLGSEDSVSANALPELRAAMRRAGVPYTAKVYPGGRTVFHAIGENPANPVVAQDLWERSRALLSLHLT